MIIEKFIELDLMEHYEHSVFREPDKIWVSELVQCKQKAYFNAKFPEIYQIEPRFWLGKIVHLGFEKWLEQEYNAKTEVEVEKSIDDITVSGRVDAIVDDTVIEIKYASDVFKNEPYEHHIKQVRLYLWLTDLTNGKLIYISPKKFLEFDVLASASDDEVIMLYDTWSSPRYPWECKYCPFSVICSRAKEG